MRTTAHGISAGVAKMGGLWAAVWFNYIDFRKILWFTACGLPIPFCLTHVRGIMFGHLLGYLISDYHGASCHHVSAGRIPCMRTCKLPAFTIHDRSACKMRQED